jgi:hypothetical protein
MSAPSRRPEIRRRRARKEKVVKLRKRLAQASNAQDKSRLEAKLNKLSLVSPGQALLKKD